MLKASRPASALLCFLLLLAGNAAAQGDGPPVAAAPRPSLLLITMDTTRPDHLQPYGADGVETPALAALAAQGVVFEQAFAVAPLTLVAHASMLTGLFPPQTGVRNNGIHYVSTGMTTLAERLREHGWRTAAFVSAAVLDHRYGLDQGFEVYDDNLSAGRERLPHTVPERPAGATVASARAWLDDLPPGEPYFLWVHLFDPHMTYAPPSPFRERYADAPYDGEIAYMDSEIGRLLAHPAVASRPDVVVIALADHGESLGEHGEVSHGILAYDSTLRIPLLVRMPGAAPGRRVAQTVSQVDLVPTVLDALHLERDPSLPGRSLVPLFDGRGPKRSLYAECYTSFYEYGWAKLRVLRRGRWKFLDGPDPELYDTARDPREQSNLVTRRRRVASNMKHGLDRFVGSMPLLEKEERLPLDAVSAERLRSLGYISTGTRATRAEEERPDPKKMIGLHVGLANARIFLDAGDYGAAEKHLRALLDKDPANLGVLIDLAITLEHERRPDEARQILAHAVELDPAYTRLPLMQAELESRLHRPEAALALVEGALKIDPGFLEGMILEAYLLDQLGNNKDAVESLLQAALRKDTGNPSANAAYAELVELRSGDLASAERRLRAVVARDPFFAPAWKFLGMTLTKAGRAAEAIAIYREGLQRVPDSEDLHARLAMLLVNDAEFAEAEVHLREAIRLSSEFHADEHLALAAALAAQKRFGEAAAEYARVLEKYPSDAGVQDNHAIMLYEAGQRDEALRELGRVLAEQPDNADAHDNLAVIALAQKDWARAEAEARKALDANPALAAAWRNLALALDADGRHDDAEEARRRAVSSAK